MTGEVQPGLARLLVVALLLPTAEAAAQTAEWLTRYPIEIEAVVRFDGTDRRSSGGSSNDTTDTEWEAGLRISQEGHLLDPAIGRFLLMLEPAYTWGDFDSPGFREDESGDLLGYLLQVDLLQGTPGPLGFGASAQRTSSLNTGSLGSRYDNEIDDRRVFANWKNPAFPMRLSYDRKSIQQEFRFGQSSATAQRDEVLETWALRGQSSKLRAHLEHQRLDDRIATREQDFVLDRANLMHRLPWGRDSELRSRFDYLDRDGFNANERLTLEELARIRHTASVFSRSTYRYFEVTQNVKTTEHFGEAELIHQLYDNLTTTADVRGETRESRDLDETRWRTGLETQYRKSNLFGASVSAGVAAYYEETDRDSMLSVVEVIDEPQLVPLNGAVVLDQRFIIGGTIIVTDPSGTLVYQEGLDYTLLALPSDLTQLQTIPGGRFDAGDTILVSYQAQALPSQEFSTTFTSINLSFDLGWARLTHLDRKTNDKLLSGAGESFLNDTRDTISDIEFRWKLGPFDTVAGAERRFISSGGFDSTTFTYRQLISWTTAGGTQWFLNAIESFTEQETLETDLHNVELSVNWQPSPRLSVRPSVAVWNRRDRGIALPGGEREDSFLTAGIDVRWRYRLLALDLSYDHNVRTIESPQSAGRVDTNEDRVMLTLTRRFR